MTTTPLVLYSGGQVGNSNTTLVTGGNNVQATIITTATFTNTDTVPHTLTVYLVRNSGSPSSSNKLISSLQLIGGQSYVSSELQGQILSTGDTIQAIADVAAKITCAGIPGYIVT